MAPAKFPRRHTQRQALHRRRSTSLGNLRSQRQHQRHRSQIKRRREGFDSDSDSDLDSDSDSDIKTGGEDEGDSGYASNSDVEAEYINGLVEKFREMGPQISNLGNAALKMIQTERRMWQK